MHDFPLDLNNFESSFQNKNLQFLDKQFSYFSHFLTFISLNKGFCSFTFWLIKNLIWISLFYTKPMMYETHVIRKVFCKIHFTCKVQYCRIVISNGLNNFYNTTI